MIPKVSAIITTYNRPKVLGRAIESVLNQSLKDFELIIVDDGSTEETDKVVNKIKDQRIIFIHNFVNLGGTKSLNIGLKRAKGEYVCPLDDDDEWIDPEKLSKQVKFLDENSDYIAVGTNAEARLIDEKGMLVRIIVTNLPAQNEEIQKRALLTSPIAHISSMYRREAALAAGGYDENLERGKDWDLFLKLGKIGKLANLPDVAVRFDEKRKVALKHKDSKAKLKIIWRHRDYPRFFRSFFVEIVRFLVFAVLNLII